MKEQFKIWSIASTNKLGKLELIAKKNNNTDSKNDYV